MTYQNIKVTTDRTIVKNIKIGTPLPSIKEIKVRNSLKDTTDIALVENVGDGAVLYFDQSTLKWRNSNRLENVNIDAGEGF
tara:strand:- start:47719 stop:47961 length:243 start_codon:yes stop_codon:yes gene_type:complete